MKKFFTSLFRFAITPMVVAIVLTVLYCHFDPFKVVRSYDDYSYPYVINNRDYISTSMFIKNYKKQGYNSFVLGSSRTLAFKPQSWQQYLNPDAKPFMFDASCETIYGIYRKLKYIDATDAPLKNVLIVICRDVSFTVDTNHTGHLFIQHPATTGANEFVYQLRFLKAYFNARFLLSYYTYLTTHKFSKFMEGYIEMRKVRFDTITNTMRIIDQENEIGKNPALYYKNHWNTFSPRIVAHTDNVERIGPHQLEVLQKIKAILEKNHTHYKVVLSPLYERIQFNPVDKKKLENLFGKQLYDFSGKNKFTEPYTNYYEKNHYRPIVGDSILSIMYH